MKKSSTFNKLIYTVLYSLLIAFVIAHFILWSFGLSFTPIIWNIWLFLLIFTLFIRFLRSFAILDLLFGIFGLKFIPIAWNTGIFVPIILSISHIFIYFLKGKYRFLEGVRSAICSFYIWLFVIVVFALIPNPHVPITIDYEVREQEIVITKGYLLHDVYYYHELINPFIMKSDIKSEKII